MKGGSRRGHRGAALDLLRLIPGAGGGAATAASVLTAWLSNRAGEVGVRPTRGDQSDTTDRKAHLWEVDGGGRLTAPGDGVSTVAFGPDGSRLITAADDGHGPGGGVDFPADPFPVVCALTGGPPGEEKEWREDWKRYLPDEPYDPNVCPA